MPHTLPEPSEPSQPENEPLVDRDPGLPDTPVTEASLVALLRSDLDDAGYTVDGLRTLWGASADEALVRGDRVPALRALEERRTAAGTLARLFVLGLDVDEADLAEALPAAGADGAARLGLVALRSRRARPLVDLRPYGVVDASGVAAWWIVSDLGELATGRELRTDHVLGVGGASSTLSALQLPDPVDSVLDLGTGCGIQALHASRFARRVVATDVSARALAFARFTAELNGIRSIEFRLGDMFAPVAGERFDRIVSNPPFVITPRREGVPEYEYRDGGRVGDGLVEEFVAALADHLTPGGTAQLLGNWEYREGLSGIERAAGWGSATGLDVWVIEREVLDPPRYAETWIRDGGTTPGSARYESLVGAWLDDFAERRVDSVGFGYLILRRRRDGDDRPPLRRVERVAETLGDNPAGLGAHLSECLAAMDAVATDADILGTAATVASDVTEERSHWPGEEHPSVISLRQGAGFGRTVRADTALAAVVGACDGELTLGVIADAVAGLLEVDPGALRQDLVPRLRELVAVGMLRVPPAA